MNSPNQMEPFNKNIIRFGGLIWCQQHFSLFTARIQRALFFVSLNQGLKNNKNKFLYQN